MPAVVINAHDATVHIILLEKRVCVCSRCQGWSLYCHSKSNEEDRNRRKLNLFLKSEQALKWAKEHPVDVAFLDIQMPGINGIELAKRLKTIDRNIRIVFVTAYEQYALEAFGVDAVGYLLKPYFREDVEKELEKASCICPLPKKKIEIQDHA